MNNKNELPLLKCLMKRLRFFMFRLPLISLSIEIFDRGLNEGLVRLFFAHIVALLLDLHFNETFLRGVKSLLCVQTHDAQTLDDYRNLRVTYVSLFMDRVLQYVRYETLE